MTDGPPSWEDIVRQVTVMSNYKMVEQAGQGWQQLFTQMDQIKSNLDDLSKKSASWKGDAADAFRKHLSSLQTNIDDLKNDHYKIIAGLDACRSHLEHAVSNIPIPSYMVDEVRQSQANYVDGKDIPLSPPGTFKNLAREYIQFYTKIPGIGALYKWEDNVLEGWLMGHESKAQSEYSKLVSGYNSDVSGIPAGTPVAPNPVNGLGNNGLGGGGGGGGAGMGGVGSPTMPKVGAGTGGGTSGLGKMPTTTGGGLGDGSTGLGSGAGDLGSGLPTGSSLAGAGGGPTGLGGGGLGGGLGGGGLSGLGSGVGAAGSGLLGPVVDPAAELAGSLGRGTGTGMGMMGAGGGHGAGHGGDEGEHATWLQEDEDVWGNNDGAAPPGVLGI